MPSFGRFRPAPRRRPGGSAAALAPRSLLCSVESVGFSTDSTEDRGRSRSRQVVAQTTEPPCTVVDMDELNDVIARRLRVLLDEAGMRRDDFARVMSDMGFRWTGNRVTQVVAGRRHLSLLELAAI